MTTDAIIEVADQEARQTRRLALFRTSRDGVSVRLENTGTYSDELIRTDDGWRFRRRSVTFHINPGGV